MAFDVNLAQDSAHWFWVKPVLIFHKNSRSISYLLNFVWALSTVEVSKKRVRQVLRQYFWHRKMKEVVILSSPSFRPNRTSHKPKSFKVTLWNWMHMLARAVIRSWISDNLQLECFRSTSLQRVPCPRPIKTFDLSTSSWLLEKARSHKSHIFTCMEGEKANFRLVATKPLGSMKSAWRTVVTVSINSRCGKDQWMQFSHDIWRASNDFAFWVNCKTFWVTLVY